MICSVATKTTGLKQGEHEVIELAIKPFGIDPVIFKVRPDRPELYDPKAQEINGISATVAAQFPDKETFKRNVLNSFRGVTAVGHYFKFDYEMILNTFGNEFIVDLFGRNKSIDTAIMAEEYNMSLIQRGEPKMFKSRGLKALCSTLEINFKTKVEAIEQVYKRLENGN